MPVESADLEDATRQYDTVLRDIAGSPPTLDLVHLGLGPDGHTASLVPGDPVLNVTDTDVALTGIYQGRRRMTLTYPAINRARNILWLVTGSEKVSTLIRLQKGRPVDPGRTREPGSGGGLCGSCGRIGVGGLNSCSGALAGDERLTSSSKRRLPAIHPTLGTKELIRRGLPANCFSPETWSNQCRTG